jgi:hypothetical protein
MAPKKPIGRNGQDIFVDRASPGDFSGKNHPKEAQMKSKYTPKLEHVSRLEPYLRGKYAHYVFIGLLFVILMAAFPKVAFLHYVPQNAQDTQSWRSASQVLIEYNKTHKDQALWDSNIFSGMPAYLISFAAKYPFIDNLREVVSHVIDWRIFLLFMAALGTYILALSWGFEPIIAFIVALGFALSCHFVGLLDIGHNTKFRASVYIPWIVWAFTYLRRNRNIFGLGALTVLMIGQLRENHPQISYYTIMILGIFWICDLIWSIRDRDMRKFIVYSLLLIAAIGIVALAVAQPYMSIREYGEYTIRGGADGVGKAYAEKWSFHPLEVLSFLAPDFFGGVSPYYWGWMPWSQVYMYMGAIMLILALFGLFWGRSRWILPLGVTGGVSLLLSFGQHFDKFSTFLLKVLPLYNKFRAPVTALVMLEFAVACLAAFGLAAILRRCKEGDTRFPKTVRTLLILFAALLVLTPVIGGMWKNTGMAKHMERGDQPEKPDQALGQMQLSEDQIRDLIGKYGRDFPVILSHVRQERMQKSLAGAAVMMLIFLGLVWLAARNKLNRDLMLAGIALLIVIDLMVIDKRFLKELQPRAEMAATYEKTPVDEFLLNDMQKNHEVFRVFPAAELGDNKWTYHHQSIGGYHASKLRRYEDLRSNCLLINGINGGKQVNWNVVDMLNAKYVAYNQPIGPNLEPVMDPTTMQPLNLYLNKTCLPRAWFVDSLTVISDEAGIQKRLVDPKFNPAVQAIVEAPIAGCAAPDSSAKSVRMTNWELHKLNFDVNTDKQAFLTVSEIYYPAGWNAYLDGKPTTIYPTDYVLRGVVIPAGSHKLEMRFEPKTYFLSLKLSLIGLCLALLLTLIGAIQWIRRNYRGQIIYVVKSH